MITISSEAKQVMIADAIGTFPDECCGFMFGTEAGDTRHVSTIMIVHNSKEGDKRRRYIISPKDYMKAEKYADENNLLLLGVYHSHPGHPSVPSETDRVNAQPYFSYIILSIRDGEFSTIQSWRLNGDEQFEEETIL